MSKTDAAPTLWWVITSHINKWVVRICLFVSACVLVAGWTIVAKLQDDCTNATNWRVNVGSYVVDLGVSKLPTSCEKSY